METKNVIQKLDIMYYYDDNKKSKKYEEYRYKLILGFILLNSNNKIHDKL